ncbi:hypothetical protein KSP40_PGU003531 [Platanthera guangdongensis]|uniref:Ribosomal protein S14 n=1 Tax=Platanthera guangdongensis TaxID=2320717 RepID=A0ABR2LCC7_9ASPA
MEGFAFQFCRAVQSYWRRRRYQRLETSKKASVKVVQLGGDGGCPTSAGVSLRRSFRLGRPAFRIRSKMLSPIRLLSRLRDIYVDSMLGLGGKGSGLSAAVGSEGLVNRRIPKRRPAKLKLSELDRRLQLEICRSIRSSGEIAVY